MVSTGPTTDRWNRGLPRGVVAPWHSREPTSPAPATTTRSRSTRPPAAPRATRCAACPIIVMTRGAKRGKIRKTPLMRVEHDGSYAVVASQGGAPDAPGLVPQPRWPTRTSSSRTAPSQADYVAHEVTGDERPRGGSAPWRPTPTTPTTRRRPTGRSRSSCSNHRLSPARDLLARPSLGRACAPLGPGSPSPPPCCSRPGWRGRRIAGAAPGTPEYVPRDNQNIADAYGRETAPDGQLQTPPTCRRSCRTPPRRRPAAGPGGAPNRTALTPGNVFPAGTWATRCARGGTTRGLITASRSRTATAR